MSAIRYRMEEQGLRQADLVPLLGSRSRVSEVLAEKRPLTVQMIRALSNALGIPARTLVGTLTAAEAVSQEPLNDIDWTKFPANEHTESDEYREKEANRLSRDAFIPRAIWRRSKAFLNPTRESIKELAADLRIHPAIVVGRLHYETGNYGTFTNLLGNGTVRRMFPEATFQ